MANERLMSVVNDALIKSGMRALQSAAGMTEATIRRVANGRAKPRRRSAYKLALACGCNEEDALALARECTSRVEVSKLAAG